MKSIIMPKTVHLSEEIKKKFLQEVKETLATNIGVKNKKRFTAGDLWNLQRNSRSASDMMRK